jgi:hypothetical protein
MFQFLCYYQREIALWMYHNLDTRVGDICLDTELSPAFKVGGWWHHHAGAGLGWGCTCSCICSSDWRLLRGGGRSVSRVVRCCLSGVITSYKLSCTALLT